MHCTRPDEEPEMKHPDTDEQEIARLLRAAGPREELPEYLQKSWARRFRNEIAPIINRRKRRVRVARWASASVAILVLTVLLFPTRTPPVPVSIQVVSVNGDSSLYTGEVGFEPLSPGRRLSPGSRITTGEDAYTAINFGGHDLRLNTGTTIQILEDGLRLTAGEVYVSSELATSGRTFTVRTALGDISDIGTQFTVSVNESGLSSSVRRGIILLTTPTGEYRAEATAQGSSRISLDKGAKINVQSTEHSSKEWEWIYYSGPEFKLEGRSVHDFLQWSSRETGLDIQYKTNSAEVYARTTILNGEIGKLNPRRAIQPVLTTTYLIPEYTSKNNVQISLKPRH